MYNKEKTDKQKAIYDDLGSAEIVVLHHVIERLTGGSVAAAIEKVICLDVRDKELMSLQETKGVDVNDPPQLRTADDVDRALITPIVVECVRRFDAGESTGFYGHVTGSAVRHWLAVLLDLGWTPPA